MGKVHKNVEWNVRYNGELIDAQYKQFTGKVAYVFAFETSGEACERLYEATRGMYVSDVYVIAWQSRNPGLAEYKVSALYQLGTGSRTGNMGSDEFEKLMDQRFKKKFKKG